MPARGQLRWLKSLQRRSCHAGSPICRIEPHLPVPPRVSNINVQINHLRNGRNRAIERLRTMSAWFKSARRVNAIIRALGSCPQPLQKRRRPSPFPPIKLGKTPVPARDKMPSTFACSADFVTAKHLSFWRPETERLMTDARRTRAPLLNR